MDSWFVESGQFIIITRAKHLSLPHPVALMQISCFGHPLHGSQRVNVSFIKHRIRVLDHTVKGFSVPAVYFSSSFSFLMFLSLLDDQLLGVQSSMHLLTRLVLRLHHIPRTSTGSARWGLCPIGRHSSIVRASWSCFVRWNTLVNVSVCLSGVRHSHGCLPFVLLYFFKYRVFV